MAEKGKRRDRLTRRAARDAGAGTLTGLESKFLHDMREPKLQPLLRVIQGLMRFRPQDRISAREALALLGPACSDEDPPASLEEEDL